MIVLTISDWILSEVSEDELKKSNWDYRIITADEKYMVIDYDKDQARPYVKALLAKVNKLKEVRMLWWLLSFMFVFYITSVIMSSVALFRIAEIDRKIINIPNLGKIQLQKPESVKDPILDSLWVSTDNWSFETISDTQKQEIKGRLFQ